MEQPKKKKINQVDYYYVRKRKKIVSKVEECWLKNTSIQQAAEEVSKVYGQKKSIDKKTENPLKDVRRNYMNKIIKLEINKFKRKMSIKESRASLL